MTATHAGVPGFGTDTPALLPALGQSGRLSADGGAPMAGRAKRPSAGGTPNSELGASNSHPGGPSSELLSPKAGPLNPLEDTAAKRCARRRHSAAPAPPKSIPDSRQRPARHKLSDGT